MGKLTERDDGTRVNREFEAPKTQVMGIIINGVLKRDLNWTMVAIGSMIAFMLELCGVSALAFAVGVYVPIQYSVPIFMGGIVRWCVDAWLARQSTVAMDSDDPEAKAKAEIEAIQKSETNPGVLLASGYIAGGSLAGVILAFFAFSDTIPKDIARWQYSTIPVTREATLDELGKDAARFKLGASAKDADVISFGKEISELSREEGVLQKWVKVPAGTKLKTPDKREILIDKEEFLGPIAERIMGREYFAPALFQTNANLLKLPEKLPVGAELKIPGGILPAILWFGVLTLLLGFAGAGWLFKEKPAS
jgi:hypothetical protein